MAQQTFKEKQQQRLKDMKERQQRELIAAAKKWALPYQPRIYEVVYYYMNGSRHDDPTCALVVGPAPMKSDGRIDLLLLRKNCINLATRESILHIDDPRNERFPKAAESKGVWDFSPEGKQQRVNEKLLEELVSKSKAAPAINTDT